MHAISQDKLTLDAVAICLMSKSYLNFFELLEHPSGSEMERK